MPTVVLFVRYYSICEQVAAAIMIYTSVQEVQRFNVTSGLLWLSSVSQSKCWDSTSKPATTASFLILTYSQFMIISYHTI